MEVCPYFAGQIAMETWSQAHKTFIGFPDERRVFKDAAPKTAFARLNYTSMGLYL